MDNFAPLCPEANSDEEDISQNDEARECFGHILALRLFLTPSLNRSQNGSELASFFASRAKVWFGPFLEANASLVVGPSVRQSECQSVSQSGLRGLRF